MLQISYYKAMISKINVSNFAAFPPLIVFWMRRKLHQKSIY